MSQARAASHPEDSWGKLISIDFAGEMNSLGQDLPGSGRSERFDRVKENGKTTHTGAKTPGERIKGNMKLKRIMALSATLMLTAGIARAVHVWEDPGAWGSTVVTYGGTPLYTPNELSLDLFGSYIAAERHFTDLFDTNIRHGTW